MISDEVGQASARGDYKRALKLLDQAIWPLSQANDIPGTEALGREATRIADETTGRTHKRALEVAAHAGRSADSIREYLAAREADAQSAGREAEPVALVEHAAVMPVSVAITAIGAVVMLIAVFLPRVESNTLLQVAKNTMVQTGDGWWFIALAVGVAGATWRAYHQQVRSWVPTVLGGIAIALAIYYGTNKGSLTLCPVQSGLGIGCSKASAGIGIYAAGVGGVLALLGGLQIGHAELVEDEKEGEDEELDTPETESADMTSRLRTLEALRADSLITDDEYAARRTALLDEI